MHRRNRKEPRFHYDAEEADAAGLLFDEGDALFGKRPVVRDVRDRSANIAAAFLLGRMEEHEGIVILTTNLQTNTGQTFAWRMCGAIDFLFPDEHSRRNIWQVLHRCQLSLSSDMMYNGNVYIGGVLW